LWGACGWFFAALLFRSLLVLLGCFGFFCCFLFVFVVIFSYLCCGGWGLFRCLCFLPFLFRSVFLFACGCFSFSSVAFLCSFWFCFFRASLWGCGGGFVGWWFSSFLGRSCCSLGGSVRVRCCLFFWWCFGASWCSCLVLFFCLVLAPFVFALGLVGFSAWGVWGCWCSCGFSFFLCLGFLVRFLGGWAVVSCVFCWLVAVSVLWVSFLLCSARSSFLLVASFLSPVFGRFPAFGFSGSRSVVPASLFLAFAAVPPASSVLVGCAAGVDGSAAAAFPRASVFRASSFSAPSWAAQLALRSSACVRAVSAASGLWVSFPGRGCPPGLVPCASPFRGSGSGSWASLALAVFLRVPSVLFLPAGVAFPAVWRSRSLCSLLGFSPCGGAFFFLAPLPPVPSLF